jgi:Galactose oxidase, central domain
MILFVQMVRSHVCLAGLALATLAQAASAQMLWKKASPKNSPGWRGYHAMAYDAARQRMVMFGGAPVLPDTWEYDGNTWVRRALKTSPSVRWAHAMVYDAARRVVVMFGGQALRAPGNILGDTWEYDGTNWRLRQPKTSPPPLMGHAMVYDSARRKVVLVGGVDSLRPTLSDRTWEYDGATWRQRHMVKGLARAHAGMVYDAVRRVIVLTGGVSVVGGSATQHSTKDPWEWGGSKLGWVQRKTMGPGPFPSWCRMVYDTARRRTVWCGVRWLAPNTHTWESWEWDGETWRLRAGKIIPYRSWHAVAYDSKRERAVSFGGSSGGSGGGMSSDTWEYYASTRGTAVPVGAGCAGSAGIPTLTADGPPILGNQEFRIRIDSANPNSSTLIGLALKPWNVAIGSCTLFLDLSFPPILFAGRSNGAGTLHVALPIPFNPALRGFPLESQGFISDPNGAYLRVLAFTNGLRLKIGD